jgi:hypothetical protein
VCGRHRGNPARNRFAALRAAIHVLNVPYLFIFKRSR